MELNVVLKVQKPLEQT